MKLDRLLSITLILLNRSMVTARELSEKYEVSIRTIYRDIETITAAGIPVISWQGKKGGFCLMDNYRVDRQLLSLTDILSILLALRGLNTTYPHNKLDDTIEKIQSLIPFDKKHEADLFFEHLMLDLSPWENRKNHNIKLSVIQQAISQTRLLKLSYHNLRNENTERTIEPMSLILKGINWYLYGFCLLKNDYRIFRLSRMYDLEIDEHTFVRKSRTFSEADFFANDKREPVHLTLRFDSAARASVEEFFCDCPVTVNENGMLTVEVSFPEDEWLYSTILGYGPQCEVLSPFHIREIIGERIKKAADLYKT